MLFLQCHVGYAGAHPHTEQCLLSIVSEVCFSHGLCCVKLQLCLCCKCGHYAMMTNPTDEEPRHCSLIIIPLYKGARADGEAMCMRLGTSTHQNTQ